MIPGNGYEGHGAVLPSPTVVDRIFIQKDLCFQAQQAAEKALKAVFIARALPLPFIHDISDLLLRLEKSGLFIPDEIKSTSRLTPFAVHTRYPGFEYR